MGELCAELMVAGCSLYLLLPRQFGKEGSLVDAVAELEKLENAANR